MKHYKVEMYKITGEPVTLAKCEEVKELRGVKALTAAPSWNDQRRIIYLADIYADDEKEARSIATEVFGVIGRAS